MSRNLSDILRPALIAVPDNISGMISISDEEVDAGEVGMSGDAIDYLWAKIVRYYQTGVHPAISFCLRKGGKILIKRSIGHARGNGPHDSPDAEKIVCTPDTPICQYSASKAVTAMMIHHLAERNRIKLTDRVCKYIPEFAPYKKNAVTIEDVLSHRAGFPFIPADTDPEIIFDHDAIVRLLCAMKPQFTPGKTASYHAITGGFILHEIIRRVTGKNLNDLVKEVIAKPLGFRNFTYGAPQKKVKDIALNYTTGLPNIFPLTLLIERALGAPWNKVVDISNAPGFFRVIIPSANLIATADEMSKFFQLLLNGGELNGVRVFNPETIKRAIAEVSPFQIDRTVVIPMRYSAGFMLGANPMSPIFGPFTNDVFGHWGFINSFSWADRQRDIAASLLTTGKPFLGSHLFFHYAMLGTILWSFRQ